MFLTAVIFFTIVSILVLIHELGHFLVARFLGVEVEEFGLGLPPRIVGKKIKSTMYSINYLPIGGFVKLAGEDDEQRLNAGFTPKNLKHLFWARSKKERAAILSAGVFMNFLLAVGITTYLLTQGVMEPSGRVHIERILEHTPAEAAGLRQGDVIKTFSVSLEAQDKRNVRFHVEQKTILQPTDLIEAAKTYAGRVVTLTIIREGKEQTVSLVPRKEYPQGQGPMGVAISDLEKKTYPWTAAPVKSLEITLRRARDMLISVGVLLLRLVTLQPLHADVAGPIGIAQVTGQAVKFGMAAVLEFVSMLSLNLAVLNILPIPALDGGRLAFVFLEKILGKRVRPAFEKSTHQIGMIILFALILLISINDILRLARG